MRILTSRAIGTAAAAAIALSTLTVQPASAHNPNNDAMVVASMIAAFGMIATAIIVSSQERRANRHIHNVGHGHAHHPRRHHWHRVHRR